jgi:chromosome segregation ATPase
MKREIMENTETVAEATQQNTTENAKAPTNVSAQFQYTADDLAKARSQEKEKVYPQIEKMREELAQLKKEKDEREAREAEKAQRRAAKEAEREAEKTAAQEKELKFKDLLKKKEEELNARIEHERLEREKALALLDQERKFQELDRYRRDRLDQEKDNIIPELLDLVTGNSQDEIEQSIAGLKERSARIFENVAQASQQTRKEMVGARITAPASGPLDNDLEQRSYSPEDLRNMSMADYVKNRSKLLGSSTNSGQGLFG